MRAPASGAGGIERDQEASALGVRQVGQCGGMNQTQESLGEGLLFKDLLTHNQAMFLEWAE